MSLRGEGAHEEPFGDLGIVSAATDFREDVAFSAGQISQDRGLARRVGPGRELTDETAGDPGSDQRIAGGNDANSVEKLLRRGVFQKEPGGSGPQTGFEHVEITDRDDVYRIVTAR
jgi:hypothetical protein